MDIDFHSKFGVSTAATAQNAFREPCRDAPANESLGEHAECYAEKDAAHGAHAPGDFEQRPNAYTAWRADRGGGFRGRRMRRCRRPLIAFTRRAEIMKNSGYRRTLSIIILIRLIIPSVPYRNSNKPVRPFATVIQNRANIQNTWLAAILGITHSK